MIWTYNWELLQELRMSIENLYEALGFFVRISS